MKITVITVTFNAHDTIERTLLSVCNQRLEDSRGAYYAQYSQGRELEVEHRVVDGASSDDTIDIVRRYDYVLWQSEPDRGLYDAMNKGMAQATGDYIVFLNAGDTLHDDHTLQHVFDTVATVGSPAVVYGQTQWVDADARFVAMRNHWAPERLTSRSFLHGMMVCHQSFYVRADLAREVAYDLHWRFSSDYDWCIRIMRLAEHRGQPMVNTHYILTNYLSEGMTTRHHTASLRERMHIMARHYGCLPALWQHFLIALRNVCALK